MGETCPSLYMVDNLEGEELQIFEDKSNPVQKVKMNCVLLFLFWCNEIYAEETDPPVDMIGSL